MEKQKQNHLHTYLLLSPCWSNTLIHSFILVFLTRRQLAKSPERVPLPPPFASYSTILRAAPSRANSYRSVPSRPREEPTVDSTITASVTSPPAVETRVPEPQVRQILSFYFVEYFW